MKLSFNNKKAKQRLVSFITAVAIMTNSAPLGGLSELITSSFSISASAADYTPIKSADDFTVGNYNFQSMSDFVDYSYHYNYTDGFAQDHQNDTLIISLTYDTTDSRGIIPDTYEGLGNSDHPFNGTVQFANDTFKLQAHRALFNYVYDSVKLLNNNGSLPVGLILVRLSDVGEDENKPLLADHVVHNDEGSSAEWKITLDSSNTNTYSGVIGEVGENAAVNLTFTNNSSADIVSNSDVGVICGKALDGSSITLSCSGSASGYSVTTSNGNAGGLVGTMEGTSVLNISSYPEVSPSVISNDGYSGGLVGKLTSNATVSIDSEDPISVGGNITGTSGAGGLFGHYTNYANEFDISCYNINTTVYGKYCGGVFGVLENQKTEEQDSLELTIKNTDNKGTISITSGTADTYAYDGYFGGLIGQYTTNHLKNSLILDNLTFTATSQASFNAFGGAIGIVDSAAYIKADGVAVNANGTTQRTSLSKDVCENYAYFGGLVGATSSTNGVFVDVGDFTLNTNSESFCGGGIVGQFYNGVLRLSGTTNMLYAKPEGEYDPDNSKSLRYSNYGQLVGYNDNVLVYALGDGTNGVEYDNGWTFKRSDGAISDDLGTWGEVVRMFKVGDDYKNAEDAEIVSFNSTEHTVTIAEAKTLIGSTVDFAKTALNIMLNQGSDKNCLVFADKSNTRDTLLGNTLTLTDNIDLSGTGINGFMRDGVGIEYSGTNIVSKNTSSSQGDIGSFTGTLKGGDYKLTLAVGESYGVPAESENEGTGQIYRHQFNGLFSVIGDGKDNIGTVENLEIDGSINVRNAGADGMNIGGIAARSHGSTKLDGITASQTVNYHEGANLSASTELGKNIGGFIGYVDNNTDNGTIEVKGTSAVNTVFKLSGYHQNRNVCGAIIGKVASTKMTINVSTGINDKLTVSCNIDISEIKAVGSNSDGVGLIGNIISNGNYSERKVNINNLEFKDCKIGNAASQKGGGLLGYSWLNTTVTIDDLTVTSATINNTVLGITTTNVGVLCYEATGKWTVNSLSINSLTMENGGGDSLGMLVNKAYNGTNGLYLDVLNAGYKLSNSGISLPSSLKKYDEIAAYSADDAATVLTGSRGVISINMNSDRAVLDSDENKETKVTVLGTYQNQLSVTSSTQTSNYANDTCRYYYNLDVMDNKNGGENLLLWSVNKYAATNLSGEFKPTNSPLSYDNLTDVNLAGLSFYPLYNADSYTLKNLAIKFDYSDIYSTESASSGGADSYTRDPGAANQHYLMHSGLFINVPTGKTITINGELSFAGTFLELEGNNDASDGYSGVLVSKTVNGNIKSASSSKIKLDGIKPMTTGNEAYTAGYLLINNITRASDLVAAPEIYIEGVYTTNKYSTDTYTADATNAPVAKSLIGAASGKGLSIEFSALKLDSRNGTSTDEELAAKADELYAAYGTYNSIFTDSTLLAYINTDQNATLVYNYTYDEDWGTGTPRNVTYGKEVTDSIEYADEENKYYGDKRWFTNPIDNTERSEAYDFSEGFLPYVKTVYSADKDENGLNYRELKVNVMTVALDMGCGTYNDPYVITDGKQLEAVANFIPNGNTSYLSAVNLPKSYSSYDTLAENTAGNRWCNDESAHAAYKPNDAGTGYISEEADASEWLEIANVQYYLANAYYKIRGDIELSDTFVGLGGITANTAFRGVIVGDKNDDGTPKYTITNNSSAPFIKVSNGCVVKDVNVVVAKENVELGDQTTYGSGSSGAYFGYDSKCKYYGGIIGEIMGGDNIIDNSYVSYKYTNEDDEETTSKITLSGAYGMLCPVGSYVGVIVFGGLIFKNIDSDTANTNANSDNFVVNFSANDTNLALESSKGAIYVNPLVGRVINGYAVNETTKFSVTENGKYHDKYELEERAERNGTLHSLKNTSKHYTIADINKNESNLLTVTAPTASENGKIDIPNAQSLFILSLITQSCSGTADTAGGNYDYSLSYGVIGSEVFGTSHIADYDEVGIATDKDDIESDYALASQDTAALTAVPYIIYHYTASSTEVSGETSILVYPARCVTSKIGFFDISLTAAEGSLYSLPDSFRGLGSVGLWNRDGNAYNNSKKQSYCMRVNSFDGNSCVIDEDIYLNRYYSNKSEGGNNIKYDNYFDFLHLTNNSSNPSLQSDVLTKTANYKMNDGNGNIYSHHGIGLFDTLVFKDDKSYIKNFTLSGSVNLEDHAFSENKDNWGIINEWKTGENINWYTAAGVCGWVRGYDQCYYNFENIILDNLSVSGGGTAGGILGESGMSSKTKNINVTNCSANELSMEIKTSQGTGNEVNRITVGSFVGKAKECKVIVHGDKENGGSTVKIKSFASLDGAVGGLVGYSGNGCEAYDMKVCPADSLISAGEDLTIGNYDKSTRVGGIVGLMQTQSTGNTDCVARFENCTIENINFAGNHSGGIYGGTWTDAWVPFSITIENCKMIGNSTSNNTISGKEYAGGFVAYGRVYKEEDGKANIVIKDSIISNYNITANTDKFVGGFIGYADAASGSVICYVHDSSIEDCKLGGDTTKNYAGGVIGYIAQNTENKVLGYNITLKKISSGYPDRMGAWVGYATSDTSDKVTKIQFTGMAIYGTGFTQNVGNRATLNNASFVFADYTGKCNDNSENSEMGMSGFNYDEDTHVKMPKYPYVNINPQSKMGTSTTTDEEGNDVTTKEIISGDGAVLYGESVSDFSGKTAEKTMAAKIYADISDEDNSRRYTTFSDTEINGTNTIDYYMKRTTDDDGDRISTYGTERGSLPSGVDDFAVVVIANTNDTETTDLINRYIQLVTNTTTNYTASSEYYDIKVNTCKFSNGKFAITDATPGLTWNEPSGSSSGTFALNGTYADSKNENTFTLVDVQFKDPLNTDNIAYHLYVPVYTIKQMEVDFSVAVKTGTTSVSYNNGIASTDYSSLMDSNGTHIDSLETWVTHYLRFTYSEDDINSLLNAGNVNWNHNKFVTFDTQSAGGDTEARLPDSTFMVLVDPNGNSDEEYYANVSDFATYTNSSNKEGWTIDLTKFKNGEDSFKVKSLNTVIARNLNAVQNEGKGLYSIGTADDYDVYRIDTDGSVQYYKYSANGDGNYDLSVSEAVNEDYYISMYVPKESTYNNQLYYYSIYGPSELAGEKSAKVNFKNTYNVLVADLYTQETTSRMTVSPDDQQISASNKKITVKASTSITINNSYAIWHLDGTPLYHSFNFSLNRYTESGVTSEIIGLDEASITAKYSIGSEAGIDSNDVEKKDLQSNYLNIETAEIMSELINASSNNSPLEIYAYIEMDFDENKLESEFPQKGSESTIGVNVAATSNLAYDSERLAYTSMSKAFDADSHYYYRESVNSAILYYSAVTELDEYESYGKMSQNQSRLGVNGYCSDLPKMPINTEAKYNVSAIASEDLELAENLRLTIMLSKKTDTVSDGKVVGAEYKMVSDMLAYLDQDIIITSGEYTITCSIAQSADSLVVQIPIDECDIESDIYNIGISFKAKTGEDFTEYANYKITLRTELVKADGSTIENSGVSDYVVYTNAKVYPTVINKAGSE